MFKNFLGYSTLLCFILNKPIFLYKNNWIVDYNYKLLRYVYSTIEYSFVSPLDIYTYNQFPIKSINYILYSNTNSCLIKLRVSIDGKVNSSSNHWLVNSWYEREVSEFFKIKFFNSCDNRCLLLPYSYINSQSVNYAINKNSYSLKYVLVSRSIKPVYRYSTIL